MKIFNFSQLGKRGNNEDNYGITAGLITVCDGMGGHNFGERASQYVVDYMKQNFEQPKALNKMDIQQKLNDVQLGLNGLLEKEPELDKMGTTFTGIFITPDVWYAAHIGDSRIYMFRPSEQKLWHTWDHSLVGELMRTHEITIEAGRFHPMSNRISKAIIAHKDGKPASASIVKIDELKAGDVFLLCSDGVVESWGDYDLIKLFSDTSINFEEKCEKLRQQCEENSKDNNTAVMIEIEEKDVFKYGTNDELEWTTFAAVEDDYNQYLKDNEQESEQQEEFQQQEEVKKPVVEDYEEKGKFKKNKTLIYLIIALIIGLGVGFVIFSRTQGNKAETDNTENKEIPEVKDSENDVFLEYYQESNNDKTDKNESAQKDEKLEKQEKKGVDNDTTEKKEPEAQGKSETRETTNEAAKPKTSDDAAQK